LVDLAVVVVVALPSLVPASLEDRFRLVAGRFLTAMLMLMTNDEMAHHSSLIRSDQRSLRMYYHLFLHLVIADLLGRLPALPTYLVGYCKQPLDIPGS
jgi:hypothetical protein